MGLYNMIFGVNSAAPVLLGALGFTRMSDVGRFRDAFISDGMIAVYTRNGGGNRDCWHDSEDWYAGETCKHESRVSQVDETVEATEEDAALHPEWTPLNIWIGSKRTYKTGNKVAETQYRCLEPNSESCGCTGCIISYRLPKHPLYVRDEDDDFDCTYATIYFKFPPEYEEQLKALDCGAKFDPDKRWLDAIEAIQTAR